MDVAQLRAFIQTARRGGFSAAARVLGLAQPSVTRQVQQLERELGFALVDRDQRPIALTPAGAEFLSFAERMVEELEATLRRLKTGDLELEGALLVAASTTPGEFLVPGLLARFTARHPRVRPSLQISDSAGVARELLAGRAEVGFLGAALAHRRLQLIPFGEDEILLAVPAGHPLARKSVVALADLAGQPLIEREDGSGTLESLTRLLARQGLRLPEHGVPMVVGNSQAQLATVEAGMGLGFVSSLALAGRSPARVVGVKVEGVDLRRVLYLAHEAAPLSAVARAFVAFVKENGSAG